MCERLEEFVSLFHSYARRHLIPSIFASLGFTRMRSLDPNHRSRDRSRREPHQGKEERQEAKEEEEQLDKSK